MTTTNPTDAQMKLARELMTKAAPMFPITTHNGPDYADVTFAEDHSSQAMTMEPDTWNALNELFVSLPAIFDAIQATEARAQGLVEALEACSQWMSDVFPLLGPLKEKWKQADMWSDYDEEVFNRRATLNLQARQALATWRRT